MNGAVSADRYDDGPSFFAGPRGDVHFFPSPLRQPQLDVPPFSARRLGERFRQSGAATPTRGRVQDQEGSDFQEIVTDMNKGIVLENTLPDGAELGSF